jgi:hypothetical protein
MAMIEVPRAEVAKLVGLPADATDEELQKAMAEVAASQKAREAESVAAAAEAREAAQDRRIVAAAVADGRLPASRAEFWCAALKNGNREANRAVVASLAPGLRPAERVAAETEMDRVHNKVMAQLGVVPTNPLRSVAASGDPHADLRERAVLDVFGLPVAQTPAPVLIERGVDPADWTPKQAQDAMLRRLGPRFHPGTQAPPKGDVWFQPSPNDVVEFKDGEWREKRPYREVP